MAEQVALTKEDMVNYIGPIFQDLKGEIKDLKTELRSDISVLDKKLTDKIDWQGKKLTDKINWQGTIMEDMRKEVKLALELSGTSFQNESAIKDHETRISAVEDDIKVLKTVKSHN